MDMEKTNTAKAACRKYWKKGLAAVLALAVLGGAGACYDIQHTRSQHAAKDAARSQLIAAQAARENVTLISEDEAKAKAAEAVGVEETSLTYDRVGLENLAQRNGDRDKKDRDDRDTSARDIASRPGDDQQPLHGRFGHNRRGDCPYYDDDRDHRGPGNCPYDEDGDHRNAPMGQLQDGQMQPPQGAPMGAPMMQGQGMTPQGQPPMMQGAPGADAQQPESADAQASTDAQAGSQNAPQPMPLAAKDSQQRPNFRFHPIYKIACTHGDVRYHVLVDATNGNVMMCDVA